MHLSQQSLGVAKLLFECICHWGLGRIEGWKEGGVAGGSCGRYSVWFSESGAENCCIECHSHYVHDC